ncbi:MAG: hypothetical protein IID38_05890 [Planctomycetes bacterium]|nr:hypothetical protein [Planctomycetota bacterium]
MLVYKKIHVMLVSVVLAIGSMATKATQMYFVDQMTDKIHRSNLDGTEVEDLITEGLRKPRDIAVDVAGGKMYWTSHLEGKVKRANLDGSGAEDIVVSQQLPAGIAVDADAQKVYWSYKVGGIRRANLDGSGVEDFSSGIAVGGLALDADNVVVYGINLIAGVDAVLLAFDVQDGADDCAIIHCDFTEPTTSSWEFVRGVVNTTADRFNFSHNRYRNMDATGATNVLDLDGGVINGLWIVGNDIMGEFAEGAIHSDDADLEVMLRDNIVHNATTGQHAIEFTAAATGFAIDNRMSGDTLGTIFDPGSLRSFGNLESAVINAGSREVPFIQGRIYTLTTTTAFTSSIDAMFDVTGGAIEILSLFGDCTTVVASSPGTMTIGLNATSGMDADSDFSTSVTVDTLGVGDVIKFSGATDEGVLSIAAQQLAGQTLSWICLPGVIEQTLSSTGTGALTWYITFRVLSPAVTVVASS